MKKASCRKLRGACDAIISGNTPNEMMENWENHIKGMISANEKSHIAEFEGLKKSNQEEQDKWHEEFENNFDSLEDI